MSEKFHVQDREFLNKITGMRAYIIGVVEDTRDIPDSDEDGWKWGQIELKIADCFEEISLEFNMSTREDRENSVYKIRKLSEVIDSMRTAIEIEAESIEAREMIMPLLRAMTTTVH